MVDFLPENRLPRPDSILEQLNLLFQTREFSTRGQLVDEDYDRVLKRRSVLDSVRKNIFIDEYADIEKKLKELGMDPKTAESMAQVLDKVNIAAGDLIPDDIAHFLAGPQGSRLRAFHNLTERHIAGYRDSSGRGLLDNQRYVNNLAASYGKMWTDAEREAGVAPNYKQMMEYQDVLRKYGSLAPKSLDEHMAMADQNIHDPRVVAHGVEDWWNRVVSEASDKVGGDPAKLEGSMYEWFKELEMQRTARPELFPPGSEFSADKAHKDIVGKFQGYLEDWQRTKKGVSKEAKAERLEENQKNIDRIEKDEKRLDITDDERKENAEKLKILNEERNQIKAEGTYEGTDARLRKKQSEIDDLREKDKEYSELLARHKSRHYEPDQQDAKSKNEAAIKTIEEQQKTNLDDLNKRYEEHSKILAESTKNTNEFSKKVLELARSSKEFREMLESFGGTAFLDAAHQKSVMAEMHEVTRTVKSSLTLLGHDVGEMTAADVNMMLNTFSGHTSNVKSVSTFKEVSKDFNEYTKAMLYGAKGYDAGEIDMLHQAVAKYTKGTSLERHAGRVSASLGQRMQNLTYDGNEWLNKGAIGQPGQDEITGNIMEQTIRMLDSDVKNVFGAAMSMGIVSAKDLKEKNYGSDSVGEMLSKLESGQEVSTAEVEQAFLASDRARSMGLSMRDVKQYLRDTARNSMRVMSDKDARDATLNVASKHYLRNFVPRTKEEYDDWLNVQANKENLDKIDEVFQGANLKDAQTLFHAFQLQQSGGEDSDIQIIDSLSKLSDESLKSIGINSRKELTDAMATSQGSEARKDILKKVEEGHRALSSSARLHGMEYSSYMAWKIAMGTGTADQEAKAQYHAELKEGTNAVQAYLVKQGMSEQAAADMAKTVVHGGKDKDGKDTEKVEYTFDEIIKKELGEGADQKKVENLAGITARMYKMQQSGEFKVLDNVIKDGDIDIEELFKADNTNQTAQLTKLKTLLGDAKLTDDDVKNRLTELKDKGEFKQTHQIAADINEAEVKIRRENMERDAERKLMSDPGYKAQVELNKSMDNNSKQVQDNTTATNNLTKAYMLEQARKEVGAINIKNDEEGRKKIASVINETTGKVDIEGSDEKKAAFCDIARQQMGDVYENMSNEQILADLASNPARFAAISTYVELLDKGNKAIFSEDVEKKKVRDGKIAEEQKKVSAEEKAAAEKKWSEEYDKAAEYDKTAIAENQTEEERAAAKTKALNEWRKNNPFDRLSDEKNAEIAKRVDEQIAAEGKRVDEQIAAEGKSVENAEQIPK